MTEISHQVWALWADRGCSRPVDRVTESDFKLTTQTRSESGSETVVTDSVILTESDAQTVRANISMANGPTDSNAISSSSDAVRANISMANGPTDSNAISSSSDAVVHKLGGRLIQTEIVSESVAGRPVPVIQTKCEVQIDRSNGGIANGPTDPSVSPPSSDSGIHSLGEQWEIESAHSISTGSTQTIKTFHSGAMSRDKDNPEENRKVTSFVRTRYSKNDSIDYYTSDGQNSDIAAMSDFSDDEDDEVQTDRVNIGVADGPTDSSVAPPSSDSGVHSLGEQWENMSANSMNTGSIQTVNTFNDSVVCQEDSKNQESYKLVFCSGTVCGEKDSMAYSTTDSQNSDIAAMSDFSDDEDESQGELRPKIRTECVSEDSIKEGSINGERSDPNTNTVGVGSKTLDPDDKEYWTKFRLLTRQAFLLDNVKLSESDYPDAVKEVVTRSRLTIIELNKGEDIPLEQYSEGEMSDDSDADSSINRYKSEYDHNLEDYRDWHYNRAPVVPNETADDEHSEPGGRARSELTPEKTGRLIDTLDVNSVINDDITVTIRDSTGVSHRQDDEIRMVSMITVDVSQGQTKSQNSNSRGIRDHVTPVGGEKQDSAAHGDIRLGGKYSIRNVTVVCSDGCDLTHRLNRAEIDWCGISVDRLIWGYHVSCLVAIVNRDRTIGRCMLMEGSGIYASTWGLEDRPVIPCDVIPVFVWMTEKFKAILNKVMLVDKATVDSHGLQWGEDNTPVRGTRASVNNRPIRVTGRFGCLYSPVQGADWLDVLAVGGGPVRGDVRIGYIGDGFFLYQSSDAAPLTDLQDLNKLLHIYSDYTTGLYLIWIANITVRISLSVEEVTSCCGEVLLCQTMDGAASADDRPGVMFTAELCVPWDAPEAVVDVNSEELISLGSFPDKVGLFGRRKEAAVSRIMTGRDSRSIRFVVPDGRLIDRGHHDVTIVDMEEDREPMVVLSDMTRL